MKMNMKIAKKRFKHYVAESLVDMYQISVFEAARLVKDDPSMSITLELHPEFVMHFNCEDWAKTLMERHNEVLNEKEMRFDKQRRIGKAVDEDIKKTYELTMRNSGSDEFPNLWDTGED